MICPACGYENFHPNATNCDLCHAVLRPGAEDAAPAAAGGQAGKPEGQRETLRLMQELADGGKPGAPAKTKAKPRPAAAAAKGKGKPGADGDEGSGLDAVLFALSLPVSFPVALWALTGGRHPRSVPGGPWFVSGLVVTLGLFALRQLTGAAPGLLLALGGLALLADLFGSILLFRRGEGQLGTPGLLLALVGGCGVLAGPLLVPARTDLEGHRGLILDLQVSGDGKRAITGSEDSTAIVWDLASGNQLAQLQGHREGVSSVALSADGLQAVTASWDGQLKVWNLADKTEIQTAKSPKGGITCVDLRGRSIAFGTVGGEVEIHELKGARTARPRGHDKAVEALRFSPDGQLLATASAGGEIVLWDPLTGTPAAARLKGHQKSVRALAFSPDSRRLYSAGLDGGVKVWDVGTGNLEQELVAVSADSPVRALAARGNRLLGVDAARNLIVWEVPGGKTVGVKQELQGNYPPAGVAWAGDELILVTLDTVVRLEPTSELGLSP